ncbi:NAD(P)-dependent oxidoreductase [Williamsia sp.]|uniref:NAD(P)-dependent oxidoreductase n=1 Tax=Williamsia sp. TaxID=1872085 RepID=UPI002F928D7A
MSTKEIGFIGAGKIGEPMVERLLAAGYVTTVYARRQDVRDRLAAQGAAIASEPDDLAQADIVIACLFSDSQVLEVCPPIVSRMRAGGVFVSHTTGSPTTIRRLAAIGGDRGISVVEAPFSGNPAAIRRGDLTVLLAGDAAAVGSTAGVLSAYSSNVVRIGQLGTAQPAKLLNNALFAACTQLTLAALQTAGSLGVPERTFLDVLAVSSGGSAAAQYISASGQSALTYSGQLPRYLTKDLDSVRAVAAELDLDISTLLSAAERGPMDLAGQDDLTLGHRWPTPDLRES